MEKTSRRLGKKNKMKCPHKKWKNDYNNKRNGRRKIKKKKRSK